MKHTLEDKGPVFYHSGKCATQCSQFSLGLRNSSNWFSFTVIMPRLFDKRMRYEEKNLVDFCLIKKTWPSLLVIFFVLLKLNKNTVN